jgi:hypothetical protein
VSRDSFPLYGWTFSVKEVSPGAYEATATDGHGHRVQTKGTNPELVLAECRWSADRSMSYPVRDARFAFHGRGGSATFDDGVRRGLVGWEMLVGAGPTLSVFGDQCQWLAPEARPMTRDEVRQIVREFATAIPTKIELVFGVYASEVVEVVEPTK